MVIQCQQCIKFRVLGEQDFCTPLALNCQKRQRLPALEVYENRPPRVVSMPRQRALPSYRMNTHTHSHIHACTTRTHTKPSRTSHSLLCHWTLTPSQRKLQGASHVKALLAGWGMVLPPRLHLQKTSRYTPRCLWPWRDNFKQFSVQKVARRTCMPQFRVPCFQQFSWEAVFLGRAHFPNMETLELSVGEAAC